MRLPPRFLRAMLRDQSVVGEFSFVHYYHSHVANVCLHFGSAVLIYGLVFALLDLLGVSLLTTCLWVAVPLLSVWFCLDIGGALVWATIFATLLVTVHVGGMGADMAKEGALCHGRVGTCSLGMLVIIGLALLSQLAGHVVFQKSLPYFSFFEPLISTPLYLCMRCTILPLGYRPRLRREIERTAYKWKGTERFVL